jgi:LmbE family N-acetylglucosaminyl deacetylase
MKLVALALTLTLTVPPTLAQTTFTDPANLRGERVKPSDGRELPIDTGASGLAQLLRKLNTRASILNIVAHPDDEDGGMLTLYARGLGARVADLSLTRGEGGQNAITGDFEDALGLLRTQELLANDRYTGVSQMFGTEVDFGFSKTKSEAFAKWTHDRVLYDAVRAIRLFRPMVITATFIGGVTDGHGQHQVSGQIAQEAFLAAADPKVFPDMIAEGIIPWQALRVYARVPQGAITGKGLYDYATNQYVPATFTNYVTGEVSTTVPTADVVVHEGTSDPILTTCAANPADLPSNLSSRPVRSAAERPADPATDCKALTYVQFARIGLGLQKSQIGPGVRNAPSGTFDVAYHLYGSAIPSQTPQAPTARHITAQAEGLGSATPRTPRAESPTQTPPQTSEDPNFFTGIDTSILSIRNLAPKAFPPDTLLYIAQNIQAATNRFDPSHPEKIAPLLAASLKLMDGLIPEVEKGQGDPIAKANALHELRIKRVQLNDAVTLALGLSHDAVSEGSTDANIPKRSPVLVQTSLIESSTAVAQFHSDYLLLPSTSDGQLPPAEVAHTDDLLRIGVKESDTLKLQPDMLDPITEAFYYRDNIEQPVYKLRDATLRNAPETPYPLTAWATVNYQGTEITLGRIVHSGQQPLSIIPPVSIASLPTATVLPQGQTIAQLTATLRTDAATSANINVESPHNWSIEAKPAGHDAVNFSLHPTATITTPQLFHVTAQTPDHQTYTEGYRPIGYGDLPRTNYYTPATTRIVPVDLQLPAHHRLAYLPGTGDAVPAALASIGLTPTILTVADLTPTTLAQYDTVILGVRTYNAHPDLHGAPTQALLDYARNGGNVVVQYQTAEFTAADAPYPLSLGANEKVVDETAPVTLLDASSPLLTTPNRITPAVFNNWIEERGHGFLETWDPHYTALTETHDPGAPSEHVAPQLPQRGGLITTPLGSPSGKQGRWTYCAFALYRQLPEAVPGAYRLFINLITPPTP